MYTYVTFLDLCIISCCFNLQRLVPRSKFFNNKCKSFITTMISLRISMKLFKYSLKISSSHVKPLRQIMKTLRCPLIFSGHWIKQLWQFKHPLRYSLKPTRATLHTLNDVLKPYERSLKPIDNNCICVFPFFKNKNR